MVLFGSHVRDITLYETLYGQIPVPIGQICQWEVSDQQCAFRQFLRQLVDVRVLRDRDRKLVCGDCTWSRCAFCMIDLIVFQCVFALRTRLLDRLWRELQTSTVNSVYSLVHYSEYYYSLAEKIARCVIELISTVCVTVNLLKITASRLYLYEITFWEIIREQYQNYQFTLCRLTCLWIVLPNKTFRLI